MSAYQFIRWKYPKNDGSGFTFVPASSDANQTNNQYLFELATRLKNFDVLINHDLPKLLHGNLKERLRKAQRLQMHTINRYNSGMERVAFAFKKNRNHSLNEQLRSELQLELSSSVNELSQYLKGLEPKARFIDQLKRQKFDYINLGEYNLDLPRSLELLDVHFVKKFPHVRILCSNDDLNREDQEEFNQIRFELIKEREMNPNLCLLYADFSYCSFILPDMRILPFINDRNDQFSHEKSMKTEAKSSSSQSNDNFINILLLGETGVGKSTFINAFVNYLTFNTLEQAASSPPAVVIPVSYLLTTGDNFEEKTVKFGNIDDDSTTENFNNQGESVTQQCRSYIFPLSHIIGKTIRIIDTPGFGDTRGLDQDDMNIKHILEFINELTHLDAVCFLVKPNISRLHISFRTCLSQLFDLLGPNARENIIFCCTNARSTFYSLGDTGPLLRAMLDSLSIRDIPFKKDNTFFFDSESFRYLVALQNGIRFSAEDTQEYSKSWTNSVDESNRLINYICTELIPYSFENEWQSIKRAQLEINQTIRPILETMRNVLRNLILWDLESSNKCIELCPKMTSYSSMFCTSCKRNPVQCGNFWILPDIIHDYRQKCMVCSCPRNTHTSIDYMIEYKMSNDSLIYQQTKMNELLNLLNFASVDFAYFLKNNVHSTTEDPFLAGLLRIVEEEKYICSTIKANRLNNKLVNELEKLIVAYKEQVKKVQLLDEEINIDIIQQTIENVQDYPMIREQMAIIKQNKGKYRNQYKEILIPENPVRGRIYLSTPC